MAELADRGGHARAGGGVTRALTAERLVGRVEELLAQRTEANERFFAAEAERGAPLPGDGRALRPGRRLVALGASPQARSDARHVAVEFVHPVIVGKRALPAIGPRPRAAHSPPRRS